MPDETGLESENQELMQQLRAIDKTVDFGADDTETEVEIDEPINLKPFIVIIVFLACLIYFFFG